ncbi:MAG: hypothetical protein JNK24_07250 [Alphaproteobacteria bacterium]|nr:hypothetical protein [Alphaproteobacteria bacterium]
MSKDTDDHSDRPDPAAIAAADEYDLEELPFDTEEDEDGEGGGRSGKAGEGGGQRPRAYRVMVEKFLDFADDPSLSPEENAERKLRLLALSPGSQLTIGASAYASENDLSSRIFMVDVGRRTGEAALSDMADPDFIDKRDFLQRMRRKLMNIAQPSLILSGLAALANRFSENSGFKGTSAKAARKAQKKANKLAMAMARAAAKSVDRFKSFLDDKDSMFAGDAPKDSAPAAHSTAHSATPQNVDSRLAVSASQTTDRLALSKTVQVKHMDPIAALSPLRNTSPLPLTAATRSVAARLPPALSQLLGRLPPSFARVVQDSRKCEVISRPASTPKAAANTFSKSPVANNMNPAAPRPAGTPIPNSANPSSSNPLSKTLAGGKPAGAPAAQSAPVKSSGATSRATSSGKSPSGGVNLSKPSLASLSEDMLAEKPRTKSGSDGKQSGNKDLKDVTSPSNEIK